MVLYSGVGMGHGHLPISRVACELCRTEHHLKVHHVVDYDREVPLVLAVIPRTDAAYCRVETLQKGLRARQNHILI